MDFDTRHRQRGDDEADGNGGVGLGRGRSALHVDGSAQIRQFGGVDSAHVPGQVFGGGIKRELALIRHQRYVEDALGHGNFQLNVLDSFAHGLLRADSEVEPTTSALTEGYLVLQINGDDDHIVGTDVVRNQSKVPVRRDEGQNLLVFPSVNGKVTRKKGINPACVWRMCLAHTY